MTPIQFYKHLLIHFPHDPTPQQDVVLERLSHFIMNETSNGVFMIKGYAGTGKTSMIATLVQQLWNTKKGSILLAPTGRAAKVIANYSNREAKTIHREIYTPKSSKGGPIQFVLQNNKHRNTIFLVDEASMIPDVQSDSKLFGNSNLLDDLIKYVYSGHKCTLVLIGDTAQLPPIGLNISPALDHDLLGLRYDKEVEMHELTQVVRQASESGVLSNATSMRVMIEDQIPDFKFDCKGLKDLVRLQDGNDVLGALEASYVENGQEGTAIIVRSNKRANLYNQQIRQRILFRESEISAGDRLMVVKNNYFWLKPTSEAGFIANGDIVEILEIYEIKELYGFRFAKVKVVMADYPNMGAFETELVLDTLESNSPSLTYDQSNTLYQEVQKDYANETSNYKKYMAIKNNRYFNALQVKFSYAITCHKSQGGQWDTVFVEQPYLPDGISVEYLRWLYTAVTRAQKQVYLLGFKDDFFID